jgi:hypothetical protein
MLRLWKESKKVAALKKAAQKLLLVLASGGENGMAQTNKVFLLLFVHKK